jgi:hypothetical protein
MKYKVVGQNRDTGARMSLEFEAESKAAAERKAAGAGMSVHHVSDVTDGHAGHGASGPSEGYRGPVKTSSGGLIKLLILLVILGAAVWYFWPKLSHMIHR